MGFNKWIDFQLLQINYFELKGNCIFTVCKILHVHYLKLSSFMFNPLLTSANNFRFIIFQQKSAAEL